MHKSDDYLGFQPMGTQSKSLREEWYPPGKSILVDTCTGRSAGTLVVGLSGGSDCRGAMGRGAGSVGAVVRDQYGKGRVRVTLSSGWGRAWWSSV
eukprot:5325381-Prymnesium_polylepis.1